MNYSDQLKETYYRQSLKHCLEDTPDDDIEQIVNNVMSGLGVFVEMKANDHGTPSYVAYHVFTTEKEGAILFGFIGQYESILKIYNEDKL